ncbi:MAG TPA: LLM class flavin-dependent oxidoreductase [Acidimicrobiales bacterium]|nr:LLM class flavin-dependent oxidoreductase [Acidimicrobiales bacterium]
MDIAIGLPGLIPGTEASTVLEWARRAEARGFHSLVVDERLVWDGYEILITAAAAAAVTERVRITASVVVAPLRKNVAEFAKQAASIDRLSAGRFVLGLGVGSRVDDFALSGVDLHERGRRTDALLAECRSLWTGEPAAFGPKPATAGGPSLLFGGRSPATFRRVAEYGTGWICATSGGVDGLRSGADLLEASWREAGREGRPRLLALTPRFALGPNGRDAVDDYVRAYNAYRGEGAEQRATSALLTAGDVRAQFDRFAEAGCDELILNPADPDPEQVDLLADALADVLGG